MSYKTDYKIEGFFEYVVPPLEGFWWQGEQHPVYAEMRTDRIDRRENVKGIDCSNKDTFNWISVLAVFFHNQPIFPQTSLPEYQ
mgnify:CR=1 FL=1